jgi:dethiobiotin synthetase
VSAVRAVAAARRFPGALVVEGAGGLYVPLDARRDVIDLAQALRFPVILVARAGLGTVNHCTLSLLALRARRLRVAAVVLVAAAPSSGDPSVATNRAELERRFPATPFAGPVPYVRAAARRHALIDALLRRTLGILAPGRLH